MTGRKIFNFSTTRMAGAILNLVFRWALRYKCIARISNELQSSENFGIAVVSVNRRRIGAFQGKLPQKCRRHFVVLCDLIS